MSTGGASTPLAPPVPPGRVQWDAVWAVFAAGLACGAYIGKVPPALPSQRAELGLSLVESGFIATTFNLIGLAVGMFVGVLCDRFGHLHLKFVLQPLGNVRELMSQFGDLHLQTMCAIPQVAHRMADLQIAF